MTQKDFFQMCLIVIPVITLYHFLFHPDPSPVVPLATAYVWITCLALEKLA